MSKRLISILFAVLVASFVAVGCGGSDGSDGARGPAGADGEPAATASVESCGVCHADVAGAHAATANPLAGTITGVADDGGGNIDISFTLTLDGDPFSFSGEGVALADFYEVSAFVAEYDATADEWVNMYDEDNVYTAAPAATDNMSGKFPVVYNGSHGTPFAYDAARITDNGDGSYVIHTDAQVADIDTAARAVIYIRGYVDSDSERDYTSPSYDFDNTLAGTANPNAFSTVTANCEKCHDEGGNGFTFHGNRRGVEFCVVCHNPSGNADIDISLATLAHGIHNGHNNGYEFEGTDFSHVGFPNGTGLTDCDTCHGAAGETAVTGIAAADLELALCMSCHGADMGGITASDGTTTFFNIGSHSGFDETRVGCACHSGGISDFHDGAVDAEEGLAEGATWTYSLVSTAVDNGTATIVWNVNDGAADVDVCDTSDDSTAGGFVFSGLDFVISDFTGDDMTNVYAADEEAQPASVAIDCSDNSTTSDGTNATTVVDLAGLGITSGKVEFALQDAPQLVLASGTTDIYVPAGLEFAFDAATGASATARRDIVDESKCYECHGFLSFHGGNRVNNVQLCATCHNPSATDQINREYWTEMSGVDWSGIDGKDAESFDLKVMLHNMHGGNDWFVGRGSSGHGGIYGFLGASDSMADYPGWDESIDLADGTNGGHWNTVFVRYPAPAADCEKCHIAGTYEIVDQTKAAAVSLAANPAGAADADQTNDLITGPNRAACTACHDSAENKAHTLVNSYEVSGTSKAEVIEMAK